MNGETHIVEARVRKRQNVEFKKVTGQPSQAQAGWVTISNLSRESSLSHAGR